MYRFTFKSVVNTEESRESKIPSDIILIPCNWQSK